MADYISREAAVVQKCDCEAYDPKTGMIFECEAVPVERINAIPAADVVEVVRCKDCIHDNSNDPICPIPWVKRMLDSYCSFGERMADNG